MKQPKTHYTRQEFDKLLSYAFYSDTDPDSWLVNGGALGAMCHLNLPADDPKLRVYEEVEMTKAANTFFCAIPNLSCVGRRRSLSKHSIC